MNWPTYFFTLISVFAPSWAQAAIKSYTDLAIDFTDAEDAADKATWSVPDKLEITELGLGWDGKKTASFQGWIETKPLALGFAHRPVQAASLRVVISPTPTSFKLPNGQKSTPYVGQVFVRHSPDRKHWSSWHSLDRHKPNDHHPGLRSFAGKVSIPQRSRTEYEKYYYAFREREDVTWQDDEEEIAHTILKEQPHFFRDHKPFIGYVQFLFEGPFHGTQRIQEVKIIATWVVSGMHKQLPPDNRDTFDRAPWKFVAPNP